MARKSDRSRRDAAPARGRTMDIERPTERDAPPVAKRGTSREGLYLDQVFPGVPQRIEIIEEKLGNSPGSRHSPAKGKKSPATPEKAPPPVPTLTPDAPDRPASVQKPSPMEKRYAELAEPASYDAPPSPARVRLEERCWPSSQRRRRAPSPPAPGSPASPLERASLLNAAPAVDREAAEEPLFCGFFLGGGAATSSNDCTYFWGAPAAPQSSGCFNPFGNGLSDDEESVS